ncbi:MAG: MFS transporter [Planctomycetota bacterium]
MIGRFSLYGFLKNQRYFEPFLVLALLDKGLSYTLLGLLLGFREIAINLLEIPTGAIADVAGRRRAMIASHLAYIASFAVFAFADAVATLFLAMALFSVGEAFRTGTHKAIIVHWLTREGRAGETIGVYGFTRSWSKIGSAVSVVIAAALVFTLRRYDIIFLLSIPPYAANIVNFLTYPRYLDHRAPQGASVKQTIKALARAFRDALRRRPLRGLLVESMGFAGFYKAGEDYLQPIIAATALAAPVMLGWTDLQRTAVLVGAVYVVLHLVSSAASRRSALVASRAGSPVRAARRLWWAMAACCAVLAASLLGGPLAMAIAITAFIALSILQNFWRPIMVSRLTDASDPSLHATALSMESQAKSLFVAVAAPVLGFLIDVAPAEIRFLPVGLLGLAVALVALAAVRPGRTEV